MPKPLHLLFALFLYGSLFQSCKPIATTEQEETKHPDLIIPFELTPYNNIKLKTLLNGKDSLDLKFDSGATGLLLTHEAIRERTQLLADSTENTPTQNYAKLSAKATLQIGSLSWDTLEVYPVQLSGQGTDGRFGWDLFQDKIVSIDYDQELMTVHQELPNTAGYAQSALTDIKGVLCITGTLILKGQVYEAPFLFDTGYQRALLLNNETMNTQAFPKSDLQLIKTNELRNGAGQVFITQVVALPEMHIGGLTMLQVPTQLLSTETQAPFETHILGNELLKRFNTILDFKNKQIYLKKNSLIDLPYTDAS